MTLRRPAWIIAVFIDVSQSSLQLLLDGDRCGEKLLAGCAFHFRAEDLVRVFVVRDGVGVEDEHDFASSSIIASISSFARR
jgi:hypothetical protein